MPGHPQPDLAPRPGESTPGRSAPVSRPPRRTPGRAVAGLLAVAVVIAALLSGAAPAAGVTWARPVPGAVVRGFAYGRDPFAAGQHRGADLAASPGAQVRAACDGTVVSTRGVGSRTVTLRCGGWRVTHLPLATVAVHAGERVSAGAVLGTLAASPDHAGLHLGVRRASDPFGYVDPLRFLPGAHRSPPTVPRVGPRARPRIAPDPAAPPHLAPAPRPAGRPHRALPGRHRAAPAPRLSARSVVAPVRAPHASLAPWPAWLGLALGLFGTIGGGVRLRLRRRPAPAPLTEPMQ